MKKSFQHLFIWVCASLLLPVLVGCTSDNADDDGTREPLVLPATVVAPTDAATQQSAPGSGWHEHDRVALQIGQTVKIYEASSANGGQLMAIAEEEPFYWTRGTSTVNIKGWYLGGGQTQRTMPATWAVAADQNADDGAGFEASEFIFAPLAAVTNVPGNRFRRTIHFYHQTSKVIVRVKKVGILVDESERYQLTSVTIGDAQHVLVMEAAFAEPDAGSYGTWAPTSETGFIVPHDVTATLSGDAADAYLYCYEALLIPQDMDYKPLLAFTISENGNPSTYYYLPQVGEADFAPGYQYIYDIEVTRQGLVVTPTVYLRPFSATADLPSGVALVDE